MSQLSDAILAGQHDEIQRLLDSGVDTNKIDHYGLTPLIETVIKEDFRTAESLLKRGAKVDAEDMTGCTALQWAVNNGAMEFCRLFLKHGADANHHSADGQPILVNPILREQTELMDLLIGAGAQLDFPQDFINAKLIGHRYELFGQAHVVTNEGKFVEIDFEGFYLEFTVGLLRQSLRQYLEAKNYAFKDLTTPLRKASRILEIASQLVQFQYSKQPKEHIAEIKKLIDSDLLVIPVSYQGHAITYVKYKNLLAKCDRGVNNITDTVIIYHVKNPYALNADFIYDLLYDPKSSDYIINELPKILQLSPIATLPTESQIAGNCSWANVEASVPAMLFLQLFKGDIRDKHGIEALKLEVMAFYAAWVEWDKDQALAAGIQDFTELNPARKASKAAILGAILAQRCYYRNPRDVERAKKIVEILLIPEYQYILKSYIAVYSHPKAGRVGEDFLQLLKAVGLQTEKVVSSKTKKTKFIVNPIIPKSVHLAARAGDLRALQELLEKNGHDPNELDSTGSTPLIYASWKGNFDVVKYLVEHYHCDPKQFNQRGGNAILYAQHAGHYQIVKYLEDSIRSKK